jgi:hypothetical protein
MKLFSIGCMGGYVCYFLRCCLSDIGFLFESFDIMWCLGLGSGVWTLVVCLGPAESQGIGLQKMPPALSKTYVSSALLLSDRQTLINSGNGDGGREAVCAMTGLTCRSGGRASLPCTAVPHACRLPYPLANQCECQQARNVTAYMAGYMVTVTQERLATRQQDFV